MAPKSEGLWLGSWISRLGNDEPFGLSWSKQYVSTLGVVFAYEKDVGDKINFDEKLGKLKKVLSLSSGRHLTILGTIAIIKTLALSKLVYNCSVLEVPNNFARKVNCVTFPFIWNFKPDKIKRNTLTAPIAKGDLNMINFVHVEKSLKAAWVNHYCSSDNSDWCAFLDFKLEEFGGPFLFQCNYDLKLLGLADLPPFYRNILSVWQELHSKTPHNIKEMKEEILWNNRFIKIGERSIFHKAWASKGIQTLNDLLDSNGRFFSSENFKSKYGVHWTFLDYAGLLAAIPKSWKNAILDCNQSVTNETLAPLLTVNNVSAKLARALLAEKSFCPPLTDTYLKEQTLIPSAVYELPFKVTIENKLRSFQFKLLHNIMPTNQRLWKMNIKTSPQCEACNFPTETTNHKFYECPVVKSFWNDVLNWWNFKRSENITPVLRKFFTVTNPNQHVSKLLSLCCVTLRMFLFLRETLTSFPMISVTFLSRRLRG